MINGTAAHGEDFDDTFEGGPVHSGAVIVPAVLAACERFGRDGRAALLGIAVGVETLCRLALVMPKAIHKAGFHPTGVLGTMAATLGGRRDAGPRPPADCRCARHRRQHGRRHHRVPRRRRLDQAPACGLGGPRRACTRRASAQQGFIGPRTVFEGTHGLFHGFAHDAQGDYDALTDDFGERVA